MSQVFVYGSLMANEVLQVLLHRTPEIKPATVHGFRRHRIKQQVFPAMIPVAAVTETVKGLDEYEDDDYRRISIEATLEDGSTATAFTYVWQEHLYSVLYGSWDYQEFRDKHLPSYVQMSAKFAEEYEAARSSGGKVGGAGSRAD